MVQLYRNSSILSAFTAFIMLHTLALRRYQDRFYSLSKPLWSIFCEKIDFYLFLQYVHAQKRIWKILKSPLICGDMTKGIL